MAAMATPPWWSSRRAARPIVSRFAIEAVRLAVQFMTPVMLLTDGYIANAAEPWRVPDMEAYEPFPTSFFDAVAGRRQDQSRISAIRRP